MVKIRRDALRVMPLISVPALAVGLGIRPAILWDAVIQSGITPHRANVRAQARLSIEQAERIAAHVLKGAA